MDITARAFDNLCSRSIHAQPFSQVAAKPSQMGAAMTIPRRLDSERPLHGVGLACLY